ncbi:hypothetical protein OIO90_005068 [Microbotryomycetes sp. JL221]|nr:hypothetical protein OIO90_005068 [Microbotryomycetes sp. JL221]
MLVPILRHHFSTSRTALKASTFRVKPSKSAGAAADRMPVEPATSERQQELIDNYSAIQQQVDNASKAANSNARLVAVSKLKPSSDILALYEHGVRHFGENYPQELEQKSRELPDDIKWHFIGALQSNKAKMLASIPNLFAIETLTSMKAANSLNTTCRSLSPPRKDKLNVYIQLNTSAEESKSGLAVPPSALSLDGDNNASDAASHELYTLATHILTECPELRLKGLMTIGSVDASFSHEANSVNPDFDKLTKARKWLVDNLKQDDKVRQIIEQQTIDQEEANEHGGLELSMGMSEDFEQAIKQGSSNVRVGSKIFGARPPRNST